MKKVLFITLLFIGFNTFSQQKKTAEGRVKQFVTSMTEQLSLTEDQASKLGTFALPYVTKMKDKMDQGKIPTVDELVKYYDDMKVFFMQALTKKQFEKFSNQMYPMMIESAKQIGTKE